MTRKLLALALLACLAPAAKSQDMPLSQILIDGEGWKKVEGKPVKPKDPENIPFPEPVDRLRVHLASGRTVYRAERGASGILAYHREADGAVGGVAPYCPLRVRRGEKSIAVGGLTMDKDGRIYAATDIGVQVFDPTGRLCGVLTPAAEGKPEMMRFEGDQLTMWIAGTKYTRKLNTTGAK